MTQTSQDTHLRPHLGQLRKKYLESIAEISCVPIECLYNHVHHEDQTDDSSDGVGNDMHTTTTQETPTALEEPDSEFKDFTKNEALQHSESLVFDGLQALYLDNNHSTYESDYSEAGQIQAQTMSQLFGTALFQNKQATNMKNVLLLLEDMISQQDQDKVNEHHHRPLHIYAHIAYAVALHHFLQTTTLRSGQYTKHMNMQLLTTYCKNMIRGIFYSKFCDKDRITMSKLTTQQGSV